jgi:hypothetical protein
MESWSAKAFVIPEHVVKKHKKTVAEALIRGSFFLLRSKAAMEQSNGLAEIALCQAKAGTLYGFCHRARGKS